MNRMRNFLKSAAIRAGSIALSPAAWVCLFGIAGAALVTSGVSSLIGPGAGLIVAGSFLLLLANFIRKGMT